MKYVLSLPNLMYVKALC